MTAPRWDAGQRTSAQSPQCVKLRVVRNPNAKGVLNDGLP